MYVSCKVLCFADPMFTLRSEQEYSQSYQSDGMLHMLSYCVKLMLHLYVFINSHIITQINITVSHSSAMFDLYSLIIIDVLILQYTLRVRMIVLLLWILDRSLPLHSAMVGHPVSKV